jgi:DNA-directed RNA polymerase subunit RPC12/RpoP
MFFRWILATYPKKKLSIDYKTLVTEFDKVVASIKVKHLEYQRYELVNGNVVVKNGTKNKDVDAIPYPATKVFSGGTRIDDYEFILLHIQAAFDLDKFGVTIGEVRGKFEEQDVWEVWAEQDYKCSGCGNEITRGEIEADHILPVKGDGKTNKDNLQILCSNCNGDKSSGMTFDELEEVIKRNSGRLTADQIKKIGQVLTT